MNMFKKVKANSIPTYMEMLPRERRDIIEFLHKLIKQTAPSLKPHFAYNSLGYGKFKYKNYKKEDIEWPVIAIANQKHYVSLYVCAVENGKYIAEEHKKLLGKVSVGKSCIRFKKLEDLNMPVLKTVIKKAAKNPGLLGAYEHK